MPKLVRWYIRTALIYFVLALVVGLLRSIPTLDIPAITPVYFHLLMVGWVTQLIIGVAYWMFPRYSKESPRGPEWIGYAIYALINLGLMIRIVGEPLQASGVAWAGGFLAISAVLQLMGGWVFVIAMWPRVKER
jgi:hypothetical protein